MFGTCDFITIWNGKSSRALQQNSNLFLDIFIIPFIIISSTYLVPNHMLYSTIKFKIEIHQNLPVKLDNSCCNLSYHQSLFYLYSIEMIIMFIVLFHRKYVNIRIIFISNVRWPVAENVNRKEMINTRLMNMPFHILYTSKRLIIKRKIRCILINQVRSENYCHTHIPNPQVSQFRNGKKKRNKNQKKIQNQRVSNALNTKALYEIETKTLKPNDYFFRQENSCAINKGVELWGRIFSLYFSFYGV